MAHPSSTAGSSYPRATYRLQFHAGFTFADAGRLAGYLRDLAISHVYASPILTARAGSMHGYDVVAYDAINPALGGEMGFCALAATLRDHGIGIILDIVPNHMAVGGGDNRMWLDVLRRGRLSPFATWFDIDFDSADPELAGKVHAPFLARPLPDAIAAGELRLARLPDHEGHAVFAGDHAFPLRPEEESLIEREGIGAFADPTRLAGLLARQNFVLDAWWTAGDRINWRRFFEITQLAAVRMDNSEAYLAKHALIFQLWREGLIDGLRIDHVDGLGDPGAYCRRLREDLRAIRPDRATSVLAGGAWLLVEKILAPDEALPADWQVDGTTGYDFMDQVSALQHDAAGAAPLACHWACISGRPGDFHAEESEARRSTLERSFDGQRERLVRELGIAATSIGLAATPAALRRALTDIIAEMRAYRGYRHDGAPAGEDADPVAAAMARAMAHPAAEAAATRCIRAVLSTHPGVSPAARHLCLRLLHHLTAPVAAKAVEDTAFYRYGRLISRNDVGFDAARLGAGTDEFHGWMQRRARDMPHAMLATATHDHKRGEDLRARLAVLSEWPEEWCREAQEWQALNAAIRPKGLDPGDEYIFYQTLAGAWLLDLDPGDHPALQAYAERLIGWWQKALREAKLRSSWTAPDEAYEAGAAGFVRAALDPRNNPDFVQRCHRWVRKIERPGAMNGLVQLALRCLVPGVPDTYQGCEFWDFSLVDPDNRRPVDFGARQAALADNATLESLAETWRDGAVKQALLRRLLVLRAAQPALFAGAGYHAIAVSGSRAGHVLAFRREIGEAALLVVAARCCAGGVARVEGLVPDAAWWGETGLDLPEGLPEGAWQPVVGPELAPTEGLIGRALPRLPVGVWLRIG